MSPFRFPRGALCPRGTPAHALRPEAPLSPRPTGALCVFSDSERPFPEASPKSHGSQHGVGFAAKKQKPASETRCGVPSAPGGQKAPMSPSLHLRVPPPKGVAGSVGEFARKNVLKRSRQTTAARASQVRLAAPGPGPTVLLTGPRRRRGPCTAASRTTPGAPQTPRCPRQRRCRTRVACLKAGSVCSQERSEFPPATGARAVAAAGRGACKPPRAPSLKEDESRGRAAGWGLQCGVGVGA